MVYELNIYELEYTTEAALIDRFERHAIGIFERLGFRLVGFWSTRIGTAPELVYLLAWEDLGERDRRWRAFEEDSEWVAIKKRTTEAAGRPLVQRIEYKILEPLPFSPLQ